jgi:hypothetical protein
MTTVSVTRTREIHFTSTEDSSLSWKKAELKVLDEAVLGEYLDIMEGK